MWIAIFNWRGHRLYSIGETQSNVARAANRAFGMGANVIYIGEYDIAEDWEPPVSHYVG